jgi:hypothetical protein
VLSPRVFRIPLVAEFKFDAYGTGVSGFSLFLVHNQFQTLAAVEVNLAVIGNERYAVGDSVSNDDVVGRVKQVSHGFM